MASENQDLVALLEPHLVALVDNSIFTSAILSSGIDSSTDLLYLISSSFGLDIQMYPRKKRIQVWVEWESKVDYAIKLTSYSRQFCLCLEA